jgi:hypothetical protein
MSWVRGREIPLAIFAICFFVSIAGYYLSDPVVSSVNSELTSWILIMANIALGTGFIALFMYHARRITRRAKGYPFSFVVLGAIALMFFAMYAGPDIRGWLYNQIFTSLTTAVICFALFYEVSGAYRAFRIRNIDALLLMVAGFILIIHFAPFYEFEVPQFADVANWILNVPSMGASRGILIGVGIGTIAIAIRILLGYEKTYIR